MGTILVFWSQCETAIAALVLGVFALLCVPLLPWIRKLRGWIVSLSLVVSVIVTWLLGFRYIDHLAPLVGADSMLSSRRLIWRDVRAAIAHRPWRGYGFFAFWDNSELTAATYQRIGKAYGSAHNSVLEVALGLGRVGLVMYLGLAFLMIVGVLRAVWRATTVENVAWAVLVLFVIVQNSMESFVLWHSYLWILFVAATVIPSKLSPLCPSLSNSVQSLAPSRPSRGECGQPDEKLVGVIGFAETDGPSRNA